MQITTKPAHELRHEISDISDFQELITLFQSSINKFFPFDWMVIATMPSFGESFNLTSNPHLPFNWDELYKEIAPYDNYAEKALTLPPGTPLVYEEIRDPTSEVERYCAEFARRHTNTEHMMVMPAVKDEEGISVIGLYRTEAKHRYLTEEKKLLTHLGPLICSSVKMMMVLKRWKLKQTAYESLFANSEIRPILLDQHLRVIDFPHNTLLFLRKMFSHPSLEGLPDQISKAISTHIAPKGIVSICTGPWQFRVKAVLGDVMCRAYVLVNENKYPVLILKFDPHGATEDFSCLSTTGITVREIEVLSYLPLGYTNRQIAMAMGITGDGVKKHLRNLAEKLGAANRAETLYQALQLKSRVIMHNGL